MRTFSGTDIDFDELPDETGEQPKPPEPKWIDSFFYDGRKYLSDNGVEFIPIHARSLRHRLSALVSSGEIDNAVCKIEDKHFVSYAGPLAGKDRGVHSTKDGQNLLATTSPTIIDAKAGDWPTIDKYLRDLLTTEGIDQRPYFFGWLKCARAALLNREHAPGHILAVAGAKGTGKTQLINEVIEPSMGGRRASPAAYLTGSNFNADIIRAELLVLDDEDIPSGGRIRQSLKQRAKTLCYSGSVRIEPKGVDGFNFRGVWRVVISCNEAEDDLRVLPPLDEGTADKAIYLLCSDGMPDVEEDVEFETWRLSIRSEIPAFLHYIENHEIPEMLKYSRGMVKAFQHPTLLSNIESLDGWRSLLGVIDTLSERGGIVLPWRGKAAELEQILTELGSPVKRASEKILGGWHEKCGRLLSDAAKHTEQVRKLSQSGGIYRYEILPPPKE